MKLSKLEQETIILYNEEEKTASVYTHNTKLISKLRRMAKEFPDKVYPEKREHCGAVSYIVPKGCISVRTPFTEERREAARARAKAAGASPPHGSGTAY